MQLVSFLAITSLLLAAANDPPQSLQNNPVNISVCDLKNSATRTESRSFKASITAIAYYDFEYGYFLQDIGCNDPVDGTGLVRIDLPPGKTINDFPELAKLSSQTWLTQSVGKIPHCTCIGAVTIDHGDLTFTLIEAKAVWVS